MQSFFFIELCWGRAIVAYTMPQQRKKEESERLRGERDQIKFIDLGFERWLKMKIMDLKMNEDMHIIIMSMLDCREMLSFRKNRNLLALVISFSQTTNEPLRRSSKFESTLRPQLSSRSKRPRTAYGTTRKQSVQRSQAVAFLVHGDLKYWSKDDLQRYVDYDKLMHIACNKYTTNVGLCIMESDDSSILFLRHNFFPFRKENFAVMISHFLEIWRGLFNIENKRQFSKTILRNR